MERKPFADDLTRTIQNAAKKQSFAVSLHGGWGTGKTYLLRRWQAQLQKEGWRVVYFNAWEDDFQADALTAIFGQLWEAIKSADWKEIIQSAKKAIPTIAQQKALGFLGLTKKDLQSADEMTVDEYIAVRKKLKGFRERLGTLAATVKDSTGFPLVFIVDELDRCRPTFAIEVLERVKHLFGAPNTIFVFGVNKEALKKSIESVYGGIDAEDYLRRFFDTDLTLPPVKISSYCKHLLKQNDLEVALNHLETMPSFQGSGEWQQAAHEFTTHLIGYVGLSCREVEHIVRLLRYAIKKRIASEQGSAGEARSIFVLAILKVKNPALYARFSSGKARCAKVINYLADQLPHYTDERGGTSDDLAGVVKAVRMIEIGIYRLAHDDSETLNVEMGGITQGLECMKIGKPVPNKDAGFLAKTTSKKDKEHVSFLLAMINDSVFKGGYYARREAFSLLDLHDD